MTVAIGLRRNFISAIFIPESVFVPDRIETTTRKMKPLPEQVVPARWILSHVLTAIQLNQLLKLMSRSYFPVVFNTLARKSTNRLSVVFLANEYGNANQ